MILNDGRVTILVKEKEVKITIHDRCAGVTIAVATMSPEQFCSALSGLYLTECQAVEINELILTKIGKKQICEPWVITFLNDDVGYPLSENYYSKEGRDFIIKLLKMNCPEGYTPSLSLINKGSICTFISKTGEKGVRVQTTIRKWATKE